MEVELSGEDDIPCIVTECKDCHRGENSLIVYHQTKNLNIRERGNNILYLRCIACGTKFQTKMYYIKQRKHG